MKYIKWYTPRIRFVQLFDDFDNYYFELGYNVWDIKNLSIFRSIHNQILGKKHEHFIHYPYTVIPTQEKDTEVRIFKVRFKEEDELDKKRPAVQFIRDMGRIWNHCPEVAPFIREDVWEFLQELPCYREEWDKWYRQDLQEQYRKPHFYRDDLSTKIPMDWYDRDD